MSSYLITGGAGFIGSHLADQLVKSGHQVTILDDLSSGKIENVNKNCRFINGSITDQKLLSKAFEGVDFCYHLAAVASVQKSIEDWRNCHKVNLEGTIQVFLEASTRSIPVIYASSAAIYGNPSNLPIKESFEAIPLSPYGLDKYSCELQAKLFGQIKGLKSLGVRFFNVYGSRQDPLSPYSGVISIFINKIRNHQELSVFGDGTQTRDFVFVKDVVEALILAQNAVSSESLVYNVCTQQSTSINRLIEVLFDAFGYQVPVRYLPPKTGDIYQSLGDNSSIIKHIGCLFQTKVTPEIFRTIIDN